MPDATQAVELLISAAIGFARNGDEEAARAAMRDALATTKASDDAPATAPSGTEVAGLLDALVARAMNHGVTSADWQRDYTTDKAFDASLAKLHDARQAVENALRDATARNAALEEALAKIDEITHRHPDAKRRLALFYHAGMLEIRLVCAAARDRSGA